MKLLTDDKVARRAIKERFLNGHLPNGNGQFMGCNCFQVYENERWYGVDIETHTGFSDDFSHGKPCTAVDLHQTNGEVWGFGYNGCRTNWRHIA